MLCVLKSWMDCGIVSIGQLFFHMGILLIMLSEQDFQMLRQIVVVVVVV